MKGIAVTFEDLSPDQVRAMVDFYEKMKSAPHTAAPPITIGELATPEAVARLNELQVPTVQAAPQSAGPGELDQDGVPYNPQFHSSSKRMTAKGQWALRKGVDKDAAAAWAKTSRTAQPASPTVQTAPTIANPMTGQHVPMTGVPTLPPVQAAPPAVDYETFADLYGKLAQEGKLTRPVIDDINARIGISASSEYYHDAGKRSAGYQELLKLAA